MSARMPADPSARLARLLAGQKLLRPGDMLNMADLAKALEMTTRNLKLTIDSDPEFPVVSKGAEGVAWQFDAMAVFAHMIAKCETVLAERNRRASRMERLSGFRPEDTPPPVGNGQAGGNDDTPLTPHELKALGDAQMTAQKLRMMQKEFMPRAETVAFLNDYHGQMQSETLGLLGRIDPAGQLPAEVRLLVEDSMRTLLVNLQSLMESFLNNYRVPAAA